MTEENTQQPEVKYPEFPQQMNLGEAGGVAYATITHEVANEDGSKGIMEISLTGRGLTAVEALMNLLDGLRYAKSKGFKTHRTVYQPPAQTTMSVSVPPAAVVAPPASVPAVPAVPAAPTQGILRAVKMDIAPRADGKVDIKFFGEGHKYADLMRVATVEQAIQFLSPVGAYTAQHLSVTASYQVNLDVRWAESDRRNSKGNPYKDILDIKAVTNA